MSVLGTTVRFSDQPRAHSDVEISAESTDNINRRELCAGALDPTQTATNKSSLSYSLRIYNLTAIFILILITDWPELTCCQTT